MTRACMSDKQVRLTIIGADYETNLVMRELNNTNAASTITLSIRSYIGDILSAQYNKETLVRPITEAHSLERLELLAKAIAHESKFFATCGGHATSDDFFKSIEIPVWEAAIKELEDKKVGSAMLKTNRGRGSEYSHFGKTNLCFSRSWSRSSSDLVHKVCKACQGIEGFKYDKVY